MLEIATLTALFYAANANSGICEGICSNRLVGPTLRPVQPAFGTLSTATHPKTAYKLPGLAYNITAHYTLAVNSSFISNPVLNLHLCELSGTGPEAEMKRLGCMGNSTMTFEQWLINLGKSPKTAQNYGQAIQGPISQWAIEAGLINRKINNNYTAPEFTDLATGIRDLDIFKERNTRGNGMYQAALKWFEAYLDDLTGQSVTEDIEQILVDNSLTATEKLVYISTRVGQGSFRQKLIDYWQGCAITKYANTQLLVASHIKPWRSSNNHERLDVYNGILLLPNYDKAFDLGYISFDESGKVCVSSEIDNPQLLGIHDQLRVNASAQHQLYLSYHRDNIFKG